MRIFLKANIDKEIYNITNQDNINHIKNVMRKKIGDIIEVVNLDKKAFLAEIIKLEPLNIKVLQEIPSNEINVEIDVYQGIPKFDKMEYIIQKSVELGVNQIYPLELDRCIVKINNKDISRKVERWNKISETAAKQSKRNYIPLINEKISINQIDFENYDLNLFLDTNAKKTFKDLILDINSSAKDNKVNNINKISIIIGPEGGFSDSERAFLNEKTNSIKLGNRILRTETASIVILSLLQYLLGDF